MKENQKGLFLAIGSAACFSWIPIIGKLTLGTGLPWQVIIFYRALIPATLLSLFFLWKERRIFRVPRRDWMLVAVNGLLFTLNFIFYFAALHYIPATVATVLLYTCAVFTALFSRLILKERITPQKTIAIALSFFGIMLVIQVFDAAAFAGFAFIGLVFGLAAGLVCGCYTALTKYLGSRNDSWTLILWNFLIAAAALALLYLPLVLRTPLTGIQWAGVVGVSLIPTLGGYSLYFISMRYIEASKTGLFVTLDPVFSITMALLILGESLTVFQLGGCLLVLGGVLFMEKGHLLLNRLKKTKAAKEEAA